MDPRFGYTFPAIRGVQAKREYYVSMCPLRIIPKIFYFDEEEAALPAELRAQRILNTNRVPEIAEYVLNNQDSYVFSAITASIDADVVFEPLGSDDISSDVGMLRVPLDSKFIINDGQHRRAAIEEAIREKPALGDESIAVVFFIDRGLERCQQMFADLNRHVVRPSKSLGILYDHRDRMSQLTRLVVLKSDYFKDLVEMEKTSLSPRSRKLFTLSAIYGATDALLEGRDLDDLAPAADLARDYWEEVFRQMPEWQFVHDKKMSAGEVRSDFIHAHGITLQALGYIGNELIQRAKNEWKKILRKLRDIDWARNNAHLWEGRAMVGGRLSKAGQNVTLTTNAIKHALGLELTPEQERLEKAFNRSQRDA
ncbi:DNA sulfur modification protein DndB [Spectribacter hydrogenoxidans]|uniref:DNA sulfur modification protein DndB n=1 Tax=Spectribacter hydrogenoxidans TaxID=3075608 RepID=A0ABU3C025_9GAMM|nr:DNA sulfur modification protein DndB [Salinisphaera sp. W335]MDT0634880.1 DNA sulfur modification protein DndB [Salinisphaera sp. W335]